MSPPVSASCPSPQPRRLLAVTAALAFLLLLAASPALLASEKFLLSGTIRDRATDEPLSAANVRVLGTSRGTIANVHGRYTLTLDAGRYTVVASMIGYSPDTATIVMNSNATRDISLSPSQIILPEVLITPEDPALEIIRRAIASKRQWINRLTSYEMDAFTRQVINRDTSIASITESYSKGYWQQGDTLREVITQRRQTANIEAAFNFASVGRILNFNEDEVRFLGYTFVGPTAIDALDYYDYKLLRTRSSHGQEVYDIRMIPRTRTVPLFEGRVSIANVSYALVGIDVMPNEAFLIPFVKEKSIRYRQQFGLYEETFWMPFDIRIDASVTIGIMGFSIPRIAFAQTSVIYNYSMNPVIPDSIFRKPRLIIDSTATKFDSTFWATNLVLPLSQPEQHAYQTLDSTQTLDVQFRPGGIGMTLSAGGGTMGSALSLLDLSFNRVEGFHYGLMLQRDTLTSFSSAKIGIASGSADNKIKFLMSATVFPAGGRTVGIGAEIYRRVEHHPDQEYYSPFFNSLTSLFNRNDYRDYYHAEGWRAFTSLALSRSFAAEVSFVHESHRTVGQNTAFSLLFRSRSYRTNPAITEGNFRSIRLDGRIGEESVPFDLITHNQISISIEHSSPSVTGGQFDFTRYNAVGSLALPTFGQSYLLKPTLRMRIAAGASSGTLPPQRLFDLESSSTAYGPFGVLRGMEVKEFSGTSYLAISTEHNFRSIPFLALGIPFLYEPGIEFVIHGAAARTWNRGALSVHTTEGWYYETGFGFSRIFDLLRIDFTWRLVQPTNFRFTVAVASIL